MAVWYLPVTGLLTLTDLVRVSQFHYQAQGLSQAVALLSRCLAKACQFSHSEAHDFNRLK